MPRKTHDSLARRIRTVATSTGERVALNVRDIEWLEFLHRHRGPLPAFALHAATEHIHRNAVSARRRLGKLYHEANTEDGGRYITRPPEQCVAVGDFWQTRVYSLAPAGIRFLERTDRWHPDAEDIKGWWKHQYLVANITASIEIECRKRGWRYIPGHEILARAGTKLRLDVPYEVNGVTHSTTLIPDALFAIDYGGTYRAFIVEADRGTEPLSAHEARKSYERNVRQYRNYVGGGMYKDHLKLNAGLVVLNVTTSAQRAKSMVAVIEAVAGKNTFQCVQHVDGQGHDWKPTGLWSHLLTDGWKRAGCPDFRITDI